jgi:hypothetical protein
MRTARLAKLTLGIALVSVLVGCTSLLNPRNVTPPPLKPDSASQANFQALNAQPGDNCSAPILEPERSALLQEALADSQLQAVKAQLEGRGFGMNADEAQAVQLVGGEQLLIPFGQDAHLVWTRTTGQTAAVGLIRQGNKTLNVGADGQERVVRFLSAQQAEKLLRKLREKGKFQDFEGKLAQKGKRVGKVRVLLDETNKIAIVGIAAEGDEKIAHQVRIKVKANKDDEPEDDAEPMIQATACGQVSGEAVPLGARMQPLMLDPGEGGDVTTGSYDISEGRDYGYDICVSQWGYTYDCRKITPLVMVTPTSVGFGTTIVGNYIRRSFVVWNYGGGRLRGTVTTNAPFGIIAGGSFDLAPGEPQTVVVYFNPTAAGTFNSTARVQTQTSIVNVPLTGRAISWEEALTFSLGALRALTQRGIMGAVGTWQSSFAPLLIASPDLSASEFELWKSYITQSNQTTGSQDELQQAWATLASIDPALKLRWFWLLARALKENRFDEVYQSLLPEGLDQLEWAFTVILSSRDRQLGKQFIQEFITQTQDFWAAFPSVQPPLQPGERIYILGYELGIYLALTDPAAAQNAGRIAAFIVEFARQFASQFTQIVMIALRNIEVNIGPGTSDAFITALEEIIRHVISNYPATEVINIPVVGPVPKLGSCAVGCQLSNGLLGILRWLDPLVGDRLNRDPQRRAEIAWGSLQILRNIVKPGTSADPFDKSWQLVGIWGKPGEVYNPSQHDNFFLVTRIIGQGRTVQILWWTIMRGDIVIVGRGDHCDICSNHISEILRWIQQALQVLDQQLKQLDKGIITYGFTNPNAPLSETQAVLDAIQQQYKNQDVAILVWRIRSDGRVEYTCVGIRCQDFNDEEQRKMACKEATGSSNCQACRWGQCPPSSEMNSSSNNPNNVGLDPAAPPASEPEPSEECPARLCG